MLGIFHSSIKIFNKLPSNIVKFQNDIKMFKYALRDYLVRGAFYSVDEFLFASHNNIL
jgi:hypothetical protein